jgi:hypothetical protein
VLRLVDFLPFGYLFGVVAVFISGRGQRLGDLVGGTLVVREDPQAFEELAGMDAVEVPAALHGVPEAVVRGATLLLDPGRVVEPRILAFRIADIAAAVRAHRPDLSAESDGQIWARVREALGKNP